MKNRSTQKKNLMRQLLSGTVYVALAAVVVAVAVNTTVGLISDKTDIPPLENTADGLDTNIPSIPDIPPLTLPKLDVTTVPDIPKDSAVSDVAEGIDALITEASDNITEPSPVTENIVAEQVDSYGIPINANLGLDKFIKPCGGRAAC